jgi:hypothetical protein
MTRHSRRRPPNTPRALRIALPIVAALSIVAPLAWLWQDSRVPAAYSVMDMGYRDYGMGAIPEEGDGGHGGHMQGSMAGHQMAQPRVVTDMIVDPARPADVRVDLVTRQKMLTVGGRSVPGFTVNRTSPGPEIRALQGQLIEVHLRNESVADGVTLHWHGVDVANTMDGVARGNSGRGAGGWRVHVPIRRRPDRHVLVSLSPGFQPPGRRRAARITCRDAKVRHRAAGRCVRGRAHLRGSADYQWQG